MTECQERGGPQQAGCVRCPVGVKLTNDSHVRAKQRAVRARQALIEHVRCAGGLHDVPDGWSIYRLGKVILALDTIVGESCRYEFNGDSIADDGVQAALFIDAWLGRTLSGGVDHDLQV